MSSFDPPRFLQNPVRVYDEARDDDTRGHRDGIVVGNTAFSPEQIDALSDQPEQIDTIELAQAVIDFLDRTVSAIDAQIEARALVIKAVGSSDPQELDWCRRAAYARTMRKRKQARVERRLASLQPVPSALPEQPRLPSPGALANIEAAKIAAASRAAFRDRATERERLFIATAREMLSREQYLAIWERVDHLLPPSGRVQKI